MIGEAGLRTFARLRTSS